VDGRIGERGSGPQGRRGIILLIVLWTLTALSLILSEFVASGKTTLALVRNTKEEMIGYYLALGAMNRALEEVKADYRFLRPQADGSVLLTAESATLRPAAEEEPTPGEETLPDGGRYAYRFFDEEGKFNLNVEGKERKKLVEILQAAGMEMGLDRDILADSILDWTDPNDAHRLNGAESDYYRTLSPPYEARNEDFSSVEELLLVKGMTRDLLYGSGGGTRLADMVTVYTEGSFNAEAASPPVLKVMRGPASEKIIQNRESRETPEYRASSPDYFTVVAEGWAPGSLRPRAIRAVVKKTGQGKAARVLVLRWIDRGEPLRRREPADDER
jgi:general secretion pathway protein K